VHLKDLHIRKTDSSDLAHIMKVEERAFGQDTEARLTSNLLEDSTAEPLLSMLAYIGKEAIGHILFTRVYLDELKDQPLLHLLAPLAVIPEYQKKGIGGLLIKEGLLLLKEMNSALVFVLGHMDYYPRFGFIPDAARMGYPAPYPIPEEFAGAWMFQSLVPEGTFTQKGKIVCANAIHKPEYWRE
jgi:putative acetyltransferase